MNRRIARVLLLLLLLAAAPLPACAFPGPPLTPQDRFCAVARAGAYTVYVRGYVRHGGGAILTLAIADAAGQPPDVTVTLAGEPPIAAQPAPAPSGDAAALAWYTLTLAPAAVAAPLRLHVAGDAGAGDATVRLLHPACDHTAPPVSLPDQTPATPVHPAQRYQAHIVQPDDLNPAWSPADASVLQQAGLPVPATATALVNVFAAAPAAADISRDTVQHTGADTETPVADDAYAAGWTPLLRADFDAGWPWAGRQQACRLLRMANTPGLGWGEDRIHTFGGSPGAAAPIMASGSVTGTARERVVQLACVFDDLAQAHNFMAQFALWRNPADAGGSLFVGASYDGRNFVGLRWQAADAGQGAEGRPGWTEQRIFFPFTGAQTTAGAGRVAVLWEYRHAAGATAAPGIRLDDLSVERFDPPALGCRDLDPTITVAGAPGDGRVSKGLNLPPYPDATAAGLAGHAARLRQSGVNWARIEVQATVGAGALAGKLPGRAGQLGYVDLKHYDTLFHLLCRGDPPIAVLALLGYHMLPDDAWRSGRASEGYRLGFTGLAATLTRYFSGRVRAWEVWNEPDHPSTYLAPDDFARLLAAVYATIKPIDADATVVLGGLSGAGPSAASYLRRTLAALPEDTPGYDALGLHPYPSTEFRANGQTIRDPSYLRSDAPTVVARVMAVMRAAGHGERPIWVTELGWNRAADSADPATQACRRIAATMVTGAEQARYLPEGFDILFKETGWADKIPGVVKVFWYQYADVGLATSEAECNGRAAGGAPLIVDWWFGLYSGTDGAVGILEPQPNPVECTFRAYPDADAISACLR